VRVMGSGGEYDIDPTFFYVYYKVPSASERGKVLRINLNDDEYLPSSYFFSPSLLPIDNKLWLQGLKGVTHIPGFFFYGGNTNFIKGTGTENPISIDWTDSNYMFGFVALFTTVEHCRTYKDKAEVDFGEGFTDFHTRLPQVSGIRMKTEIVGVRSPSLMTIADRDDEDYAKFRR